MWSLLLWSVHSTLFEKVHTGTKLNTIMKRFRGENALKHPHEWVQVYVTVFESLMYQCKYAACIGKLFDSD